MLNTWISNNTIIMEKWLHSTGSGNQERFLVGAGIQRVGQ